MINASIDLVKSFRNEAAKAWAVDKNDADLIKGFEGCRLKAYLDQVGVPTIGWGSTRHLDGRKVKLGDVITQAVADQMLLQEMNNFSAEVKRLVKVPVNDNQGAALLSFQFNTGGLAGSTLLRKLNARDYDGAADQFLLWVKATDRATGQKKIIPALVTRRGKERLLFKTPC